MRNPPKLCCSDALMREVLIRHLEDTKRFENVALGEKIQNAHKEYEQAVGMITEQRTQMKIALQEKASGLTERFPLLYTGLQTDASEDAGQLLRDMTALLSKIIKNSYCEMKIYGMTISEFRQIFHSSLGGTGSMKLYVCTDYQGNSVKNLYYDLKYGEAGDYSHQYCQNISNYQGGKCKVPAFYTPRYQNNRMHLGLGGIDCAVSPRVILLHDCSGKVTHLLQTNALSLTVGHQYTRTWTDYSADIPAAAEKTGSHWLYEKADGGMDKRYKNNKRISDYALKSCTVTLRCEDNALELETNLCEEAEILAEKWKEFLKLSGKTKNSLPDSTEALFRLLRACDISGETLYQRWKKKKPSDSPFLKNCTAEKAAEDCLLEYCPGFQPGRQQMLLEKAEEFMNQDTPFGFKNALLLLSVLGEDEAALGTADAYRKEFYQNTEQKSASAKPEEAIHILEEARKILYEIPEYPDCFEQYTAYSLKIRQIRRTQKIRKKVMTGILLLLCFLGSVIVTTLLMRAAPKKMQLSDNSESWKICEETFCSLSVPNQSRREKYE